MREFQVIIDGVTYDVQVSETSKEEQEQSFIPMEKIEQQKVQDGPQQKVQGKSKIVKSKQKNPKKKLPDPDTDIEQ